MLKTLGRWMALRALRNLNTKSQARNQARLWKRAGYSRLAEELRRASKEL